MPRQDKGGNGRGCSNCPSVGNSAMVHSNSSDVEPQSQANGLDVHQRTSDTPVRQGSQHERQTEIDGLSLVRRQYQERGIPEHIASVLLCSWRTTTHKQYAVHLKKWAIFCGEREIAPYSPSIVEVLEFLHSQLHLSYSSLNTARSALSCIITLDQIPVGKHPLVCRFLKGAFERKPPSNRYYAIWDVQTVLQFLKTFSPNKSLSLKELSLKVSMLLALVTIQRKQTLLQLSIADECLKTTQSEFVFILSGHVKQSRPNYPVPPVIIPRYTLDTDICPYDCLKEYITRTSSLRQDNKLFISFIKPHKAIGSHSLS